MQPYNAKNRKNTAIPDRRFARGISRMPAYAFFDSHFSRFLQHVSRDDEVDIWMQRVRLTEAHSEMGRLRSLAYPSCRA